MTERQVEILSNDGGNVHATVTVTTGHGKTFVNHVDLGYGGGEYCTCFGKRWCRREHIEPVKAELAKKEQP